MTSVMVRSYMRCLSDIVLLGDNSSSFVFFVFFKLKTAYDMRISDWSSDVCSCDLACVRPADPRSAAVRHSARQCPYSWSPLPADINNTCRLSGNGVYRNQDRPSAAGANAAKGSISC